MLKKIILGVASASALVLAMGANADSSTGGFYAGAQAGYGYSDIETIQLPNIPVETNKGGFAGRVDAGYRINQYFGIEVGGSYLPHSNYKIAGATITLNQFAIDLMGMGYLPIHQQLFAYAGLGGAVVFQKAVTKTTINGVTMTASSDYENKLLPKVAAGLGYNVTKNVALTAGYDRIFGVDNYVSINEFTVGVQYTF